MKLPIYAALLAASSISLLGQVHVLASNGVRAVIEELQPKCEQAVGSPVEIEYGTSTALRQKIEAGDRFDIAILTSDVIDALIQSGKLSAKERVNIARAGIGVGIRKGAPKPDIRTADSLKGTLLAAKAITYAGDGASRVHIEEMFQKMGIADVMKKKTILEQGSTRANERVAAGSADIILTLVSEILPAPGVELAGSLPAEFQSYVGFAAAANAKGAGSLVRAGVLKFLAGPAVGPVLRTKGMEPFK